MLLRVVHNNRLMQQATERFFVLSAIYKRVTTRDRQHETQVHLSIVVILHPLI